MSELLSSEVIGQLKRFKHIIVAYSGGLDSTVLLHALANQKELAVRLKAVHINHQISPHAANWVQHAQQFCQQIDIPFSCFQPEFDRSHNVEAHAREARYQILAQQTGAAGVVVTGHHQQDQAETLLLRLCRGSGIRGLAAMSHLTTIHGATVLRPLLDHSRQTLEAYAKAHQLLYVEDESNDDITYTRNFIRHKILPKLEDQWLKVVDILNQTAQHMSEGQSNLDDLAKMDLHGQKPWTLDINLLKQHSQARANNMLRYFLHHHGASASAKHIRIIWQQLVDAREDANPEMVFGEQTLRRYRHYLYVLKEQPHDKQNIQWSHFPEDLPSSQGVFRVEGQALILNQYRHRKIEISFRAGGEHIYLRQHHRSLKKVMQELGIPPWMRDQVPLFSVDGRLEMVIGYTEHPDLHISWGRSGTVRDSP